MTDSATVSVTLKTAWPEALVVALTVVTLELPPAGVRLTFLPATGFKKPSRRVTVMVDLVEPSAGTEVGLATAVDLPPRPSRR